MFGTLKLGKFFGIDTYIHGTFWLLPLFVLFRNIGEGLAEIAFSLLFVFAVFFCIALHEVGHALAARAYGIGTRDITLYPIGGIASLERMPEKPWREVAVALAGPAVNVILALGLLTVSLVCGLALPWASEQNVIERFHNQLIVANVFLFGFNLLPCFPMDGGRVLRAMLSLRMSRLRATEVAVKVGTVTAIIMLIAGVVIPSISLMAIAVVMWLLGQAERARVRIMEAAKEFEARARGMFDAPPPSGAAPEPTPTPEARALPVDAVADLAARRFSGLAWDSKRRVWVQWVDGVPVRELPS